MSNRAANLIKARFVKMSNKDRKCMIYSSIEENKKQMNRHNKMEAQIQKVIRSFARGGSWDSGINCNLPVPESYESLAGKNVQLGRKTVSKYVIPLCGDR